MRGKRDLWSDKQGQGQHNVFQYLRPPSGVRILNCNFSLLVQYSSDIRFVSGTVPSGTPFYFVMSPVPIVDIPKVHADFTKLIQKSLEFGTPTPSPANP
jgi:hypothetical protein